MFKPIVNRLLPNRKGKRCSQVQAVQRLLDSKDHPAINDWHVKLGKEKGEFARHNRKKEDELFFVVRGRLTIKTRDRDVDLREGEFLIIPRGVEHKPVAGEEAYLVLLESRPP